MAIEYSRLTAHGMEDKAGLELPARIGIVPDGQSYLGANLNHIQLLGSHQVAGVMGALTAIGLVLFDREFLSGNGKF